MFFGQQLFDNLLGWAIDHTIGVELAETDLQQRKKGDADVHHFEISGQGWIPNDSAEAREIAASFLLRFGTTPPPLRRVLGDALRALNLDEVKPLVEPSNTGRWRGAHTLLHIRRFAIMHVHFLWGRGTHNKKQALEEVAQALAASVETLRTWERRWLPEIDPDTKSHLAIAKRAGDIQRQIDEDPEFVTIDKTADALRQVLSAIQTLEMVAEEHRQALRTVRRRDDTVG